MAVIAFTSAPSVSARIARFISGLASATQLLLDVRHLERFDDRFEMAVHHPRQIVRGEADAVIGDAALRVVVGADLRRAVAGAHLGLSHPGPLRLLLADSQ